MGLDNDGGLGANVASNGGVNFRVWAPACERVDAVLHQGAGEPKAHPLARGHNGYFTGRVADAAAGTLYSLRLDNSPDLVPDPASRYQPHGLGGPSQVVDPSSFHWSDAAWQGVTMSGQVIYEMHIGTFTAEGTWAAAMERLPALADLGITLLEVMPVSEFHGRFGWGYDTVLLYAVRSEYGSCDDFRRFVDRAHALGLGVILDVVYNHLGPGWEFLKRLSPDYVSKAHSTEWGETLNFDAADCGPVRDLVVRNAAYWVREYHIDGLRIDATQQIFDDSPRHILADIGQAMRREAGARNIVLIGENEPQRAELMRGEDPNCPRLDALWNDDLHHSAIVAVTGRKEGYYSMHNGSPQELISAAKWGWLYQGQVYPWQDKPRGTPSMGVEGCRFVNYIQNHDQVANTIDGRRFHMHASPGCARAITAYLLLIPGTPMLFQGQEWCASTRYFFFSDFHGELGASYHKGRREFLAQFRHWSAPELQALVPDPNNEELFRRAKLDWAERDSEPHAEALALHRDLLRLRREDPVFAAQNTDRLHGVVLGPDAFALRFFGENGDDRLLVVNLGRTLEVSPAPEPLLAPPHRRNWRVLWNSEEPGYGGVGLGDPQTATGWYVPGHAAFVCRP